MFKRTNVLGIAAAAALGVAALFATSPASAQSWSITIGSGAGYGYGHPVQYGFGNRGWHDRRSDVYQGFDRPGWRKRHHHGFYAGPQCFTRKVRYWDGWGWTVERRRICH